jgi:prepilin-type N-terminal cleavage/methylation domain-containing protein
MGRRRAFTLIELLTVIAIIAVLAAIILPVLARAKDNAYRNSDISNMNAIRAALQLYRVDQGAYPPALLGYVTLYSSGPNMGQVMPANEVKGFLYNKRVPSIETLRPAYNRVPAVQISTAVWPLADPRAPGTAAQYDLDGNGSIDNSGCPSIVGPAPCDDPAEARQAFGPTQVVQRPDPNNPGSFIDAQYYMISGYDVALVPTLPSRVELRYSLFWTVWGLGSGHVRDDPRQLGYDDPAENTVVTWNSFYRNWQAGVPNRERRDLVLFLGGGARPMDSRDVHERSWRMLP